jgi:hypothetical protein
VRWFFFSCYISLLVLSSIDDGKLDACSTQPRVGSPSQEPTRGSLGLLQRRSDAVHPAGMLTHRDLSTILPMLDDTVVLQATGQQLLDALENGVSMYPKLEGRFPQVMTCW